MVGVDSTAFFIVRITSHVSLTIIKKDKSIWCYVWCYTRDGYRSTTMGIHLFNLPPLESTSKDLQIPLLTANKLLLSMKIQDVEFAAL